MIFICASLIMPSRFRIYLYFYDSKIQYGHLMKNFLANPLHPGTYGQNGSNTKKYY